MLAEAIEHDGKNGMRERRCIVTGEVREDAHLIRFVADPDGNVVPDLAAKLPGRGMWVSTDRATLERAIEKNLFAKAAKSQVKVASDLADRVEALIVARMQGDLGLARRAAELVMGFDNVVRALEAARAPDLLIEACDGAADGRRKISGAAHARGLSLPVIECLTAAELSVALGRENVIHAALKAGALARRLIFEAGRLKGFRTARGGIERSE